MTLGLYGSIIAEVRPPMDSGGSITTQRKSRRLAHCCYGEHFPKLSPESPTPKSPTFNSEKSALSHRSDNWRLLPSALSRTVAPTKQRLPMNPGMTRRCDVSKAHPSVPSSSEYFIRLKEKKKRGRVHLIRRPAHEVLIL